MSALRRFVKPCLAGLLLLAMHCFTCRTEAQVDPEHVPEPPAVSQDTWHIAVSPYLWMAGLNGNLTVAGHEAAVNQSFGDILGNLKFGVMGLTEVRRGRFGLLTDLIFARIGDQKAIPVPQLPYPVNVSVTTNTFTLTPELAYRLYSRKYFAADALGGFRYYHMGAGSTFDAGALGKLSYSSSDNWADVVGGARFLYRPTDKVGFFFLGDAGGGA